MKHVLSGECDYMEESLHHMCLTINEIIQAEFESFQQCWVIAQTTIVNMDVRAVTPDALREVGLTVKALVGKVGARLCPVDDELILFKLVLCICKG